MRFLLLFFTILTLSGASSLAENKLSVDETRFQDEHVTIYLTENRVCKKCTWRVLPDNNIELKNKLGVSGIYNASEIIGATKHPLWRKFMLHTANNTALGGENILPSAIKKPSFNYGKNHDEDDFF